MLPWSESREVPRPLPFTGVSSREYFPADFTARAEGYGGSVNGCQTTKGARAEPRRTRTHGLVERMRISKRARTPGWVDALILGGAEAREAPSPATLARLRCAAVLDMSKDNRRAEAVS